MLLPVAAAQARETSEAQKQIDRQDTLARRLADESPTNLAIELARIGKYGIVVIQDSNGPALKPGLAEGCTAAVVFSYRKYPEGVQIPTPNNVALVFEDEAKISKRIAEFNRLMVAMPEYPEPHACKAELGLWDKMFAKAPWDALGLSESDYNARRAAMEKTAFYFHPLTAEKEELLKKIDAVIAGSDAADDAALTANTLQLYPAGSDQNLLLSDFTSRRYTASALNNNFCAAPLRQGHLASPTPNRWAAIDWCAGADGKIAKLQAYISGNK